MTRSRSTLKRWGDTDSEIKSFMLITSVHREFRVHLMQCGSHRGNGVRGSELVRTVRLMPKERQGC